MILIIVKQYFAPAASIKEVREATSKVLRMRALWISDQPSH